MKQEIIHDYWFKGPITPATSAGVSPWRKTDTSENGTPTLAGTAGFMKGALDSTNEAQNLCLSFGDDLCFDIDDLIRVEFWMKIGSQGMGAACTLSFGLAAARNDDPEAMAAHMLFKLAGSTSVVISADDGVNDYNAVATGDTLTTTVKRFQIDLASGVQTRSRAQSLGGKGCVLFAMSDSRNNLRRVAENQLFDLSNYSSGLQPFVQLQKTAAATVAEFHLQRIRITERLAA